MPMGYAYIVDKMEANGEREAAVETAKNLLDEFNDEAIAETTGLSLEEVIKLRIENNRK